MNRYSQRHENLRTSPIRDIMHAINVPGMVSLAGGLPSPDSFPALTSLTVEASQLQYGASEGEQLLREYLAESLNQRGIPTHPEQVLILTGSQQGIDLAAKLFVDPDTVVAIESPTYLAALQTFNYFGARYLEFVPGQNCYWPSQTNQTEHPSLVYAVPNFQNPTGHVYSMEERQGLAAACDQTRSVLFEDDPYRDIVFEPCDRTPICSLLKRSSWIYQSSLSKTLAPGLRLGYMTSSPDLFPKLVQLKQAADLHSCRVAQQLALALLNSDNANERLQQNLQNYTHRKSYFNDLLNRIFGDLANWETPKGGLFFWLKLNTPYRLDTRKLLPTALQRHIAFMPGEYFYPVLQSQVSNRSADHPGIGTLRLNFSHASEHDAAIALEKLAELIKISQVPH